MNTLEYVRGILANTIGGPSANKLQRVQKWDLYSTMPFYNDGNLNGVGGALFSFGVRDTVVGPGFVAASPPYQASNADTNMDSKGNLPFDFLMTGLSLEVINRQYTPGTVGTANDLAFWPALKSAMMSDMYAKLTLNDTDLDRLPFLEAPAGAGIWGAMAMGTSAALTVGASQNVLSNGWPDAMNIRDYTQQGPIFIALNSTVNVNFQFGNSVLAASTVYKPVSTGAPTLFVKGVLRGLRIWWAQ